VCKHLGGKSVYSVRFNARFKCSECFHRSATVLPLLRSLCGLFSARQKCTLNVRVFYKPSRYKSEALCLWSQRCNTAKPTLRYNSFPQVQSDICKTCNTGSGCSFYRTPSR
jgi:hypothetical protein